MTPKLARNLSPHPLVTRHSPLVTLFLLLSLFTFHCSLFPAAQAASFSPVEWDIQPRILNLGETALAIITFHGPNAPDGLALFDVDGLSILCTGVSHENINGTQSVVFSYSIFPRRVGEFTLGPYRFAASPLHKAYEARQSGESPAPSADLDAITIRVLPPPPEHVIHLEDIPADLPACMAKLDAMLSEKDKAYIRENDPILLHFSLGMGIRNEWGLWCDEGIPLVDYFRAHGIQHPDDMSGAILDCYAWHLRGEELDYEAELRLRARNAPLDMDQAPETSEPASAPSTVESPATSSP